MAAHAKPVYAVFAETTGISGILYAYRSSKFERIFWCVLTLIALCVTIKDVVGLIKQYRAELTVIDTTAMTNDSISLPDPAICLRVYAANLWPTVYSLKLDVLNTTVVQKLISYVDRITDIPTWIRSKPAASVWGMEHTSFLTLTTCLYLTLAFAESRAASTLLLRSDPSVISASWSRYMSIYHYRQQAPYLGQSLLKIRNYLVQRNVDFLQLRSAVAQAWLREMQLAFISPDDIDSTWNSMSDDKLSLVWFGLDPFVVEEDSFYTLLSSICFRLHNSAKYFTFDAREGKWLWAYYVRNLTVPYYADKIYWAFDSLDIIFSSDRGMTKPKLIKQTASFPWINRMQYNRLVTYVQKHSAVDLLRKPCSAKLTNFDCQGACRARFLFEHCKCYPSSWAWDGPLQPPKNVPLCGLRDVVADSGTLTIDDLQSYVPYLQDEYSVLQRCVEQCRQDCVTTEFTFEDSSADLQTDRHGIMISEFQHTVFTERIYMTRSDFISNFGGIAGVWSGACMLSYVHLVIFFLKWLFGNSVRSYIKKTRIYNWINGRTGRFPNNSNFLSPVKEFVETTAIEGAKYAYMGNVAEKLFWGALILVSFCLTLTDTISQMKQYGAEDTVTDIQLKNNASIALPNPSICLRPAYGNLIKVAVRLKLNNASFVSSLLSVLDDVSDIPIALSERAKTLPLNVPFAAVLLLGTNALFVNAYRDTVATSSLLHRAPTTISNRLNKACQFMTRKDSLTSAESNGICDSTLVLQDYLVKRAVNFMELRQVIGLTWLSQLQPTFLNTSDNSSHSLVSSWNVKLTWFGYEPFYGRNDSYFRICAYNPSNDKNYFAFTPTAANYLWTVNPKQIFAGQVDPMLYSSTMSFTFTTERTEVTSSLNKKTVVFDLVQGSAVSMSYPQTFAAISTRQKPCTKHSSRLDVKGACLIRFLVGNCGCYPLSWAWDGMLSPPQGANFCDFMTKFQDCLSTLVTQYEQLEDCYKASPQDCRTGWMSLVYSDAAIQSQRLQVSMSQFQYLELNERLSLSLSDLMANLGGVVGVWNGACVLTYIHILIFIIKWALYKWTSRNNQTLQLQSWLYDDREHRRAVATKKEALVKEFVETTGIDGIAYAFHRKRAEKVFWTVLICGAMALTLRDLIYQTEQYLAQHTVTDVEVHTNQSIRLPNVTTCLTISPTDMLNTTNEYKTLMLNSVGVSQIIDYVSKKGGDNVLGWLAAQAKSIGSYALNANVTAFMALTTFVMFDLAFLDVVLMSSTTTFGVANRFFLQGTKEKVPVETLRASMRQMQRYLTSSKIDPIELRKVIALLWIAQSRMVFVSPMSDPNDCRFVEELSDIELMWFGPDPFRPIVNQLRDYNYNVCFRHTRVAEYFTFSSAKDNWFWAKSMTVINDTMNACLTWMTAAAATTGLDFVLSTDRTNAKQSADNTISYAFELSTAGASYYITFEKQFTSLNLPNRPCSSEVKEFDCKIACQARLLTNRLGCVPYSWLWDGVLARSNDSSLCGWDESMSDDIINTYLAQAFDVPNALAECRAQCFHDCTKFSVGYQPDPERQKYHGWVALKTSWFQHTVFKERLSMTSNDFVGNIGGILGVWTGACILTYIHAIIFAAKWISRKFNLRKKLQRTRPSTSPYACASITREDHYKLAMRRASSLSGRRWTLG